MVLVSCHFEVVTILEINIHRNYSNYLSMCKLKRPLPHNLAMYISINCFSNVCMYKYLHYIYKKRESSLLYEQFLVFSFLLFLVHTHTLYIYIYIYIYIYWYYSYVTCYIYKERILNISDRAYVDLGFNRLGYLVLWQINLDGYLIPNPIFIYYTHKGRKCC